MNRIKVACVGDSITEGVNAVPYPDQLASLLGKGYEVRNFGKFGAHLRIFDSPWSYSRSSQYREAMDFLPDAVLFMLGTNDRLEEDYPFIEEYFSRDFARLTDSFLSLPSRPRMIAATSPRCYLTDGTGERVNGEIRRRQLECAAERGIPSVDMNSLTKGRPDLFPDGLHPDTAGNALIADAFYSAAFGGKLRKVTVYAPPGTSVTVGLRRAAADAEGKAVISAAEGRLKVYCENVAAGETAEKGDVEIRP